MPSTWTSGTITWTPIVTLVDSLPSLPRDDDGPVFREPWQAEIFAITLTLHEAAHFTWAEWAEYLAAAIAAAKERGEADMGDTYYLHWLRALETILNAKGVVGESERVLRKEAWARAARETEYGKPIELPGF